MNTDFWRGRKIFVTGHTGFKGSWLSLWLQKLGASLFGYSLAPPTQPNLFSLAQVAKRMHSAHGDMLDLPRLREALSDFQPEFVFHLAAQSLVRESYANPLQTFATNVMGTANLLDAVRNIASVRVVIIVTSDKCYENLESRAAYRELDPLGGNDPYSSSKACAELVTSSYRHSFFGSRQHDLGITSVRSGNVIGGGDWAADRLVPDAIRAVIAGQELQVRNPGAVRPWQHVLDPLRGYLMLAEKLFARPGDFSGPWNFGPSPSSNFSVAEILDRLQKLWGEELRWRADPGVHVTEAKYLSLDSNKAKKELGWEPRLQLDSALLATVNWYKAYLSSADMARTTLQQIEAYEANLADAEISHG
ncbi:MAG TPA: CDP-glucose 4,6-dehydratase [Dongiaceae bacterium]|nr:CDP-glucose 4,6-dehydratase [Dongiaceae bacterium]